MVNQAVVAIRQDISSGHVKILCLCFRRTADSDKEVSFQGSHHNRHVRGRYWPVGGSAFWVQTGVQTPC